MIEVFIGIAGAFLVLQFILDVVEYIDSNIK